MATQLWDKEWRDRWMADYAEKGNDGKWRARSGRPVQDVDLMSGAGGVAPKAPAPSAPVSAPAATPSPATTAAPPSDAGEPASAEDKAEIRASVKRLGWKNPAAKAWLRSTTGGKANGVDELSAVEARTVLMLLEGEEFKLSQAAAS
jgi:hypothetical protein